MIIFLGIPAGIAAGVAAYIMGGSFPIILAAYTLGVVAAALPFYLYLGLRNTAQARVPRSPRRRETRQRRLGSVFVARTVSDGVDPHLISPPASAHDRGQVP